MGGADDVVLKQGHGEAQIIDKIENILSKKEPVSTDMWGTKNTILCVVVVALLLSLGFIYYT